MGWEPACNSVLCRCWEGKKLFVLLSLEGLYEVGSYLPLTALHWDDPLVFAYTECYHHSRFSSLSLKKKKKDEVLKVLGPEALWLSLYLPLSSVDDQVQRIVSLKRYFPSDSCIFLHSTVPRLGAFASTLFSSVHWGILRWCVL